MRDILTVAWVERGWKGAVLILNDVRIFGRHFRSGSKARGEVDDLKNRLQHALDPKIEILTIRAREGWTFDDVHLCVRGMRVVKGVDRQP